MGGRRRRSRNYRSVIPGRVEDANPESRDSPMRNCASEVRANTRPGMTAFRPSLTRLGVLDVELAERARHHEIIVVEHKCAGDAVLEQLERHRIDRRLLA